MYELKVITLTYNCMFYRTSPCRPYQQQQPSTWQTRQPKVTPRGSLQCLAALHAQRFVIQGHTERPRPQKSDLIHVLNIVCSE